MSDKYTYATVGISEGREEPVVVTGKRNVSFEIGGEEFDRTATLRLPERMTNSEFNQWKSESGIDLIDIYFHCIKQKPRHSDKPAPEDAGGEVGEEEQSELVTDGGGGVCPSCGEKGEQLPNLGEHLRACMNLDCRVNEFEVRAVTDGGVGESVDYVVEIDGNSWYSLSPHSEYDAIHCTAGALLAGANEVTIRRNREAMTDGGSSMPKLALSQLKELREVDSRLGDLLTEQTGDELESFSDIYATEHSIEAAGNEIQLGEGFSIPEAEFVELLGIIEHARASAADDPVPLGVRNRLLMQLILANPEEYARIKKEEAERQQEAQEEARQQFNEAISRQRMNERMADLNDGVDIPLDDGEDTDG